MGSASVRQPDVQHPVSGEPQGPDRQGGVSALWKRLSSENTFRYTMAMVLVAGVVIFSVISPTFRTPDNFINILQQSAIIGVIACGMAIMIVAGGFDLSVGAVAAAAGVLAGVISIEAGVGAGIVAGLLLGLAVGAVNGTLIAKVGINPFVATLGSAAVVQGLLFVMTEAKPIFNLPETWSTIGFWRLGGIPSGVLVLIAVALLTWALLRFTLLGKWIYAVGSNKEGTRRSGVRVDRVVISAFTIGGILAALGGILLVTQSNVGQPAAGTTYALAAIAAVVVGGTPLTGGSGGVSQAIIGTLILGVLSNGLSLLSISPYWQPTATGILVVLAVAIESQRRRGRRA
jgi:ribose transport system permease protein